MKKIKTLSFAFVGAVLLLVALPSRRAFAGSFTVIDSTSILVLSTGTIRILAPTQSAYAFVILSSSGSGTASDMICLSNTVPVSTQPAGGNACFPAASTFTLYDYNGGLYAILRSAVGGVPLSVFRKR